MMKKAFMTSALCISMACPAFAEFTAGQQIADENGLLNGMACDVDTLGVTQDTANLEAIWTANTYSENPGYYLSFENGEITQNVLCPAGSYCPGFEDETFADASMGIYSCSTETGGVFPNSVAGSRDQYACYTPSTITCAEDNALTVANGSVTYANETTNGKSYVNGQTTVDNPTACAATVTCNSGYTATAKGILADYKYVNMPWLDSIVRYKSNNVDFSMGDTTGLSNGQWEVTYADGTKVYGIAECSVTNGTFWTTLPTIDTTTPNATKCWCKMEGYQFSGSSTVTTSSSSWVFGGDTGGGSCEICVSGCAGDFANDSDFRGALFGALGDYPTCGANTISLNWYDDTVANGGDIITPNNSAAEQCTYDGALTLPSNDMSNAKPGYVFGGWRVREEEQNNGNGQD